jgi:Ca2+-binding RTX toxin-like protein
MMNARKRRTSIWALGAITAALALPAAAQADTFTFNGPGVSVDNGSTTSTIDVSGLAGPITGASAVLGTVTSNNADDVDSAIVAPNGTAVFLMSDACGGAIFHTLQFSDSAPIFLSDAGPCDGNPYKPSNYGGQVDDPVAGAFNAFSFFNGGDPNGTWTLVFADDTAGNTSSIGSWSLTLDGLTVAEAPPGSVPATPGATAPNPERVACAGRPSTQLGSSGADTLIGTAGPDVISGVSGNDQISGVNGADLICGGDGKDILKGGNGKDILRGELGKDTLKGGNGKDALKGGPGKDKQIQ